MSEINIHIDTKVALTPEEVAGLIINMDSDEQMELLSELADANKYHAGKFAMQLEYIASDIADYTMCNDSEKMYRISRMFDLMMEYFSEREIRNRIEKEVE